MARNLYRWTVPISRRPVVPDVPEGAVVIAVRAAAAKLLNQDAIEVWGIGDPDAPKVPRKFAVAYSGDALDDDYGTPLGVLNFPSGQAFAFEFVMPFITSSVPEDDESEQQAEPSPE